MFRSLIVSCLVIVLGFVPLVSLSNDARAQGQTATQSTSSASQASAAQERSVSSVQATAQRGGVLLEWSSNSSRENLRLHIFRSGTVRRTFEAINPDLLTSLTSVRSGASYSYQWFDPQGTKDSIYYIESSSLNGRGRLEDAVVPVSSRQSVGNRADSSGNTGATYGAASTAQSSGASAANSMVVPPQLPESSLSGQWAVAAQVALKIRIKTDGWYRVTQAQMTSAGFSPTVDVRNLALFGDGEEYAIRTSKATGLLGAGDYIEFYGQGLDTLDSDTRVYYLIAGATAGKRVQAEPQGGSEAIETPPAQRSDLPAADFTYKGRFVPLIDFRSGESKATGRTDEPTPIEQPAANRTPITPLPLTHSAVEDVAAPHKTEQSDRSVAVVAETPVRVEASGEPAKPAAVISRGGKSKKSSRSRRRRAAGKTLKAKPRYNHAAIQAIALSFDDTLQIKERFNYNTGLPVGLNFFGSTIGTAFPLSETFAVNNLQANPDALARVEVALQGLSLQSHQVNILCNNVLIGTLTNFFGREHKTQSITFPASLLVEANNQFKIVPVPSGEFLGLDHISLTYPRGYRALNNALRFTARSTQTFKVDGFSTQSIQLLDITNPANVTSVIPAAEVSGGGFAITVPVAPRKKGRTPVFGAPERQPLRTLYALPQGQFLTPAEFALNQPSTLNQAGNSADLIMIAAKDFIPSLNALKLQRQQQGLSVVVVDVEDVYDEFSFGAHSPTALHDFLSWARSHWTTAPRYVLLGGDASYDSRGHFAIVLNRAGGGCSDTNNNAIDFAMGQFGNPHNSGFHNSTPCPVPGGLVISQVYTGNGDKQASYANSFIELYNRGSSPVNVSGWSVQYASATGSSWQKTDLGNVTIQPGNYYLVQEAGFGGIFSLPTPDSIGAISMNFAAGKVALVNNTSLLIGSCATGANVVDSVSYGSTANCFEGSGPAAVSADFVPTQQVDTLFGVACSDDALTDFVNDDGIPEIPTGRLPARTPAEMDLMVSKIVNFSKTNVPQTALFVADAQGTYYWNFETHSDDLANLVPQTLTKQKIYLASQASPAACEANIINTINSGVALVNYQGHGNVNVWSGSSIFTTTDAQNLTNGNRLPLVIVADCLNGLFNDPVLEGLGETILKAPLGGGVAAYASSGETIPDGQQEMSIKVFQLLFGPQSMALGDVTKQAKGAVTSDLDVRRTWILLGDPSMKIW